jgi:hypothetical protein
MTCAASAWTSTHGSAPTHAGIPKYAAGVVGLTPGRPARLLDVTQGRSGGVYADWLAARPKQWRDRFVWPP